MELINSLLHWCCKALLAFRAPYWARSVDFSWYAPQVAAALLFYLVLLNKHPPLPLHLLSNTSTRPLPANPF